MLSPGNIFIGRTTLEDANRRVRARTAKVLSCNKSQITDIEVHGAKVHAQIPGNALVTVYRDHLGDTMSVLSLMRPGKGGGLRRWDNDLTFSELRNGQHMSETTRQRLRERNGN